MMNENIVKKRAYRALIKLYGKCVSKEIRQYGFKFSSDYGNVFKQLESFYQAKYETSHDI